MPAAAPRTLRLFIAVTPSAPQRDHLLTLRRAWLEGQPDGRWRSVPPENLHLTLAFLGSVEEARRDDVITCTQRVAVAHPPFPWRFGTFGCFPTCAAASVLWVGLEQGEEAIIGMARELDEALLDEGLAVHDERNFQPHLTFARATPARHEAPPEPHGIPSIGPEAAVTHLDVIESRTHHQGADHVTIARCPLRAP